MNTATLPAPSPVASPSPAFRVTRRSVARAEWIKFRSVRSNLVSLASAAALLVALGVLFSSLAGSGETMPPDAGFGGDSMSMVFGGIRLSQLVLGVLGAVFVAGEYATGMIRTMFASVADRVAVLRAKAIVLGATTWVVMTVASFVVFFAGEAVYAGTGATYGLGDDGVLRAVLGGGVYGAGVVLMGLALGFLLRSTAAAIGTLVAGLMIAPVLVGLLPDPWGDTISKFLPSNAGQAFLDVQSNGTLLSPGTGFLVFAAWVFGLLLAARLLLTRRDA